MNGIDCNDERWTELGSESYLVVSFDTVYIERSFCTTEELVS
jgi:hypothetical protein